jgi:peptidoglycan/LPS O-acetylase OafA/YrhL
MPRIHKLDGLRGLFALFVVLFHFNVNNAPAGLVNNFFVRESFIFVDFFFILSGFVITITYNESINSGKSFLQFLKKRFIRLYPMLLFSTGMYWYFVRPFSDKHHIFLALDTLLLTNSTPILGTTIGMNYPSWSISSEMISYLAFGICSLLVIRKKKNHLIIAITIACFGFLLYQQNYFQTGSWGFIRGLACFNLGYLIHLFATKNIKIHDYFEGLIMIIILGMMYFLFHLIIKNTLVLTFIHLLVPIVFAFSIFILIKTNGIISKLLQTTPLQFLGKISYSLYLNQALIIGYSIPKLYKWIKMPNEELKKIICVLIILTILVVYSWLTQLIIEQKLGKRFSGLTNTKS